MEKLDELLSDSKKRLLEYAPEMYELLNAVISSDYDFDKDLLYDIECLIDRIDGKEHNPDLKHCPFCGAHAELYRDYFKGNTTTNNAMYFVSCKKCSMRTPSCKTPHEAINLWNARKEDDK